MQNPLDHFLSDLANKIQTAKEYKDIINDSQNVDVNKNVFEGFMLGVAETIKKELKDQLPETTQIEAVSSIADQQKDPEPQEDPLAKFVNTLASTISANKNKPIEQEKQDEDEEKKVEDEPAPEPQQDSFEKFIGNLKDIIQKTPKETPVLSSPIVDKKDKPKAGVKDYVKELVKNPKDENEEKPKNKSDLIKDLVRKFVEGEIKGFKDEISQKFNQVGAAYGGGGGTNAVQYANGGTMNGDLNVNGHILSGGVDLLNIFSGGGPTDRLVSGSYQVVLSSNGAVTFPDNLTIDNSTISNLTLNDYGGGSSVLSGSQIEVVGDRTTITNGVTSTAGASILAARGQVTLDSNKAVMEYGLINSLGGESVLISQNRFAAENDAVMEQVVTNTLDESSSLIVQNQVIVNSNVLIGRRVTTITDGNTLTNFSGWTFDNTYGSLTFPNSTTQTTAFTGNPDSSNWDSTYTTVKNTSGYWSQAYTNLIYNSAAYLSGVDISLITTTSASWNSVYTSFNSNSAKYDSNYTTVNNNSSSWSSVYTNVNSNSSNYALTNTNVIFQNNVTVLGNLTAKGTATFANTIFTTTSALSVVNTGPGPALYVFQSDGPSDVASFYDGDGVEVLHVGNAQGGGNPLGQVGINTSFPSAELTVNGAISSNGTITVLGGNSNQWNSNYTTTNSNSANWNTAYTNLVSNSANYLSGYDLSAVAAASGTWNAAYTRSTELANTSATWNSTSTVVQQNSGNFVLPAGLEILTDGPSPFGDLFHASSLTSKYPQSIRLINSQFNLILFDNTFNPPLNISYNGNVYSGKLYLGGMYYSNNASMAGPTYIGVKNLNVLMGNLTFNSMFSNGILFAAGGNTSTATGPVSTLEFPNLSCVVGNITITNCVGLTAVSFPELELVDADNTVGGYSIGIAFGGSTTSQGNPPISLESVSFPKLKYISNGGLFVGGYYGVSTGATRLREVSLPLLSSVNSINIGNTTNNNTTFYSLTTFNMPSLRDVQSITFGRVGLSAIQFENLLYMTGQYSFASNPYLKDIISSKLKTIGGYIVTITSCPNLSGIYLNNLETLAGNGNSISFSSVTTLSALYFGENTLNSVSNISNSFTCNSSLTRESVDSVLKAFSRLDGTGIRSTFGSGQTLNLAGGNRPPSYTGGVTTTSAGTNFTRAGTTVTANVVGHAHTTGDIVTFTGNSVAALNGTYAVTVVTANQFQYTTSTSGAATGGSTVTMRRTTVATDGFRYYQTIALRGTTITINFP